MKIKLLTLVLLLITATQVRGQKFDEKNKKRIEFFIQDALLDSAKRKVILYILEGGKQTREYYMGSKTTEDSLFIFVKDNNEINQILNSYGDTMVIEISPKIHIKINYKNGELGLSRNLLKLLEENLFMPVSIIPLEGKL